jgi:glycosyltransferase involved in cell wall biosynthesis
MLVSIIIPSFKSENELQKNKIEIENSLKNCKIPYELILTCQINKSAAINRNYGLNHVKGDIIIQVDDDIQGFFDCWIEPLIKPLLEHKNIILSSARLMKTDGITINNMNGHFPGSEKILPWVDIPAKRLPFACIAYRKNNIKFCERYIGSGFEDSQFCEELKKLYPEGKFVISNICKLIHLNEQKNQTGKWDQFNRQLFYEINGHW